MRYPETPNEVRCLLKKLANLNWFSNHENGTYIAMPLPVVHQAIEEFVRTIEAAHFVEPTISACERLVAALFIAAIEEAVTAGVFDSNLVTIEECQG